MQIVRLEIRDFKCLKHLVLDNLGQRVVLVGPNGCGKSSILQAVAALKEFIGTYSKNQNLYLRGIDGVGQVAGWPDNTPPVRVDQPYASISARLKLNPVERALSGTDEFVDVGIRIHRNGRVEVTSSPGNTSTLFRHFDPESGVGVIDYIHPQRLISTQRLGQININSISTDEQRNERIELTGGSSRFNTIKTYIISEELEDLSHLHNTGDHRDSIRVLRDIFAEFFAPKSLLGYRRVGNEMQVAVRTPFGNHDIDHLSSGERELFFIIASLYRIRKLPSVILYDEPERHVNSKLESRIIPVLDRIQTENQIWIASHGLELIASVPMQDIVALSFESECIIAKQFRNASETERVRLFESIGARVGLQLAARRIVFVEGKDAHADKQILDKLIGPSLAGVLFVASGSSVDVVGAGSRAALLMERASADAAFAMVLDRDYRTDEQVKRLRQRLNDRVYVLNCHEVENLLLDWDVLLETLQLNGCEDFNDAKSVELAAFDLARSLATRFTYERAAHTLHSQNNSEGPTPKIRPQTDFDFQQAMDAARSRSERAYSESSIKAAIEESRVWASDALTDGRWATVFPGKELLDSIRVKYLRSLQYDALKQHLVHTMVRMQRIPSEAIELQRFVDSL